MTTTKIDRRKARKMGAVAAWPPPGSNSEKILMFVIQNPGCSTNKIIKGLRMNPGPVRSYLTTLIERGKVIDQETDQGWHSYTAA